MLKQYSANISQLRSLLQMEYVLCCLGSPCELLLLRDDLCTAREAFVLRLQPSFNGKEATVSNVERLSPFVTSTETDNVTLQGSYII